MSLSERIAAYQSASQYFLNLAVGTPADLIDVHHENGWSARQVIHHMADSEAQSYARLRRLVAEPEGSVIQGYDEAAWAQCAQLGYIDAPVENSIAVFAAVRASSLDVLKRLTESDLAKSGVHTEAGKYSIDTWLETYTRHPHEHGDQLVRATKGQE
jgi:DinB superfamily